MTALAPLGQEPQHPGKLLVIDFKVSSIQFALKLNDGGMTVAQMLAIDMCTAGPP